MMKYHLPIRLVSHFALTVSKTARFRGLEIDKSISNKHETFQSRYLPKSELRKRKLAVFKSEMCEQKKYFQPSA